MYSNELLGLLFCVLNGQEVWDKLGHPMCLNRAIAIAAHNAGVDLRSIKSADKAKLMQEALDALEQAYQG